MSDYRDSIVKSYYDAMRGVPMVSSTHHVGYQMGLAETQRRTQRQAQSNGAATGGDDVLEVMARSIPDGVQKTGTFVLGIGGSMYGAISGGLQAGIGGVLFGIIAGLVCGVLVAAFGFAALGLVVSTMRFVIRNIVPILVLLALAGVAWLIVVVTKS